MLTQLKIQNYQRHTELTIAMGRVTSLVGPTDAGKSSVIRAMWWMLTNDGPTNPGTHGTNDTVVSVTLDDGTVISRNKSTRGNGYTCQRPDGSVEPYNAIGHVVPKSISDLLCVNVNSFQGQHDSAYWLSQSGAEVGRALNSVVDLDVIETGLTFAKKLHSTATAATAAVEKSIAAADAEVSRWQWVEEATIEWEAFSNLRSARNAELDAHGVLSRKLETALKAVAKARELSSMYEDGVLVNNAVMAYSTQVQKTKQLASLCTKAENKLEGLEVDCMATHEVITASQSAANQLSRVRNAIGRACNPLEGIAGDAAYVHEIQVMAQAASQRSKSIKSLLIKYDASLAKYNELAEQSVQMASKISTCPTCGREL